MDPGSQILSNLVCDANALRDNLLAALVVCSSERLLDNILKNKINDYLLRILQILFLGFWGFGEQYVRFLMV